MLNLEHIFEEQDRLNKETAAKHVEYSLMTQDQLTRNYIFAALCELGECTNEWAHHKIWKATRKENRDAPCKKCQGSGMLNDDECPYCERGRTNPLREEYIDVLHFVVSVAIGFNLDPYEYLSHYNGKMVRKVTAKDSYDRFLKLYRSLSKAEYLIEELEVRTLTKNQKEWNAKERVIVATEMLTILFELGFSLGFDHKEIEDAYFSKHKINQVRQANNY